MRRSASSSGAMGASARSAAAGSGIGALLHRSSKGRQQQQQQQKLERQQQLQKQQRQRMRRPSQLGFVADHSATPSKSMLQSMLTLYGMLALMLGLVIPISDALAKPVEHADYRQIFYVIMHGVGTLSIVYLDILISFHKSDPLAAVANHPGNQQLLATVPEIRIDDEASEPSTPTAFTLTPPPPLESLQSAEIEFAMRAPASELPHREFSDAEEVRRMAQTEMPLLPLPHSGFDLAAMSGSSAESVASQPLGAGDAVRVGSRRRAVALCCRAMQRLRRQLKAARASLEEKIEKVKKQRDSSRITWSSAGVNIYLRLGSIVFGFGVMVHDGFKIVDVLEKPGTAECAGPWFLPTRIVHLVFILCQTHHLFKHHRVAINTQNSLVRFILVHLMVTNLCIWAKTVIYEIKLSLLHSGAISQGHGYETSNGTKRIVSHLYPNLTTAGPLNGTLAPPSLRSTPQCRAELLQEDSPSHKLGPYLYPCAVEYGLICAAICYKLFTRVGDTEAVPYGRKETPVGPRATTCHKSHKGLFLGLFIMICVLVPTISLIFLQRHDNKHREQHAMAVIAAECLVLSCTTAMALLGTVKAVRQMKLHKLHGSEAFDVNLLFVGLAGVVCYNLFVTISVGACLVDTRTEQSELCQWGNRSLFTITRLAGLKSLLEVTQSVVQTLFVMQAIQRKVTVQLAVGLQKPGRGITIALLIANLAMWVTSVFEAQRDIADNFLLNYFGEMPWSIIKYIFLPLIIFYRFHSTVCLSEIWIQSYKLPKLHSTHS